MVGIIDIGSNTIRLVMYENTKKVSNTAVTSEILHDTVDGYLTQEGTQKLCSAIEYLKNMAGENPVYAIATFAFRVLENCKDVKKEIFEKTGILVDILSGKDEARCDFNALLREIGTDKYGVGADLGGGSAQIFYFEKDELLFFESYAIGSKKMKKKFVNDIFPTPSETEKIRECVKEKTAKFNEKSEILYMMGGTAKTALRIYGFMKAEQNPKYLETKDLDSIIEFIKIVPEDTVKNVLRSRYDNITSGILVMDEIAKMVGAKRIFVLSGGVREGYLSMHGIE